MFVKTLVLFLYLGDVFVIFSDRPLLCLLNKSAVLAVVYTVCAWVAFAFYLLRDVSNCSESDRCTFFRRQKSQARVGRIFFEAPGLLAVSPSWNPSASSSTVVQVSQHSFLCPSYRLKTLLDHPVPAFLGATRVSARSYPLASSSVSIIERRSE